MHKLQQMKLTPGLALMGFSHHPARKQGRPILQVPEPTQGNCMCELK